METYVVIPLSEYEVRCGPRRNTSTQENNRIMIQPGRPVLPISNGPLLDSTRPEERLAVVPYHGRKRSASPSEEYSSKRRMIEYPKHNSLPSRQRSLSLEKQSRSDRPRLDYHRSHGNQHALVPYRAQKRSLSAEDYEYERPAKRPDRKQESSPAADNRAVVPFVRRERSKSPTTSNKLRPYRRHRQQSIECTPEPDIQSGGWITLH